jgi:hypothetical protein
VAIRQLNPGCWAEIGGQQMIKREETADNINKRIVTPPPIEVNFGLMRSQLVDLR